MTVLFFPQATKHTVIHCPITIQQSEKSKRHNVPVGLCGCDIQKTGTTQIL